jgi:two-component system response regulator MprA
MRVLVVDDERAVRDALSRALRLNGFEVELAPNGQAALQMLDAAQPDVVLLDVLMPGIDGLETCRRIRAAEDPTPVLMLTARDGVDDRVEGLDVGADDYLPKPFALAELLARVRALLRRRGGPNAGRGVLEFADLTLDREAAEASRGARAFALTRIELLLLELFLLNPRRVLSRETLVDRVWDGQIDATSNAPEVYVGYLRKKLEANGEPRLLRTVRGLGYVLREPHEAR